MYRYGTKFDALPYLSYQQPIDDVAQIAAHEGRHRSRALEGLSEPYQLVRMIPAGREELLSKLPDQTKMYSEMSSMNPDNPERIGSLGELLKILGIPLAVAPGALSSLGGEDGS